MEKSNSDIFESKLKDFKILTTGAEGGHIYLHSNITFKGQLRKLIVFFKDKTEEDKLKMKNEITVQGNLTDQGLNQSLILNNAIIK